MKTDVQIQQAVLEELGWDTRVDASDVGVEVDHGVVTLTGTVDNWPKRVAAQEAAHRVEGVRDVANDLQVHVPGTGIPTDTEIALAVRQALELDVRVPDTRIQTTVSAGDVTLTGAVDLQTQRADAESAVQNLRGVRCVINEIRVAHHEVPSRKLRQSIADALERRAERAADRVQIEVHGGEVTLSGTVQSTAEHAAILGTARTTAGVTSVVDHLRVAN